MGSKHLGLKVAVGVLFTVMLATYGFYWTSISRLNRDVMELVEISNHLKHGEKFHSSLYSMLLEAEAYAKKQDAAKHALQYAAHRAEAEKALSRLTLYSQSLPSGRVRNEEVLRTKGITTSFNEFRSELDAVINRGAGQQIRSLNLSRAMYVGIFKNYYLHMHQHHAYRQNQLSQNAGDTWATAILVFLVQLGLAVGVGVFVAFYLDRVVLKIFSFTERMAYRDKLTGLNNRAALDRLVSTLDGKDNRPRRRYALIMLDIDHFKDFNDTHGHQAGDRLLADFASIILENVRSHDQVVRYGGEEFLVILYEAGAEEAISVAEKLREVTEGHRFQLPDGMLAPKVTVSLGVALYPQDGEEYRQVVRRADDRMYKAKRMGRNQVRGPGSGPGLGDWRQPLFDFKQPVPLRRRA